MACCLPEDLRKIWKVDDATPERYPNRMIAYLSDKLYDTAAVAVDVGQHMVWSYPVIPESCRGRNFFFPADMELWDTHFRRLSELIMHRKADGLYLRRRCTPDEYPGTGVGEERESSC